jgi:hypothetical protein
MATTLRGAANAELNSKARKPKFRIEDWPDHCQRFLGMRLIPTTDNLYGGDCPFCGGKLSLFIWIEKRLLRCFNCGLKGKI